MAFSTSHYFLAGTPRLKVPKPFKPSQSLYMTSSRSTRIRAEICKFPLEAIEYGGKKVNMKRLTIGDVVSKTSLNYKARKAIQALAADTNGFLELSGGDLVDVFPKDYQLKLPVKSVKPLRVKIESFLKKAMMAAVSFARATFAVSLAASSVFGMTMAVLAGKPGAVEFVGDTFSAIPDGELIELVVSIAFGDGDPNQGIEEKRWKLIEQYIALNGGVVTAEELTPYLDLKTSEKMDDESYMVPVLLQFDGKPVMDDQGNTLYHFPSVCAPERNKEKELEKFLKETKWEFRCDQNTAYVNDWLSYNLFWVIALGACYAPVYIVCNLGLRLAYGWSLLPTVMVYLHLMYVVYAIFFFGMQFVRWISTIKRNAAIVKRNEAREKRAEALETPHLSLKRKLLSARNMARTTSTGKDGYHSRDWDLKWGTTSFDKFSS